MITNQMLSKIISTLGIRKFKGTKIQVKATKVEIREFLTNSIDEILKIPEIGSLVPKNGFRDIFVALEKVLFDWNNGVASIDDISYDTDKQKEMEGLVPFINATNGEVELRHTTLGGVSKIHSSIWLSAFGIAKKDVLSQLQPLFPIYRPDRIEQVFPSDIPEIGTHILNNYSAPMWRVKDMGKPEMPPLLRKFFFHLFSTDESREAIFHHLYYMLTSRSQVLLCLAGRQAIGKSIFAETIVKAMIKHTNWAKAPRSFTKKEFNGFLKNRKAVVVEEIPLASSREERIATNEMIKDILNDTVTIEEKGLDSFTTQNYVSVFVTTNSPKAIPLVDMNDRRFLCLDVTKVQLRKTMTSEEIEELKNLTDSSEEIADFCQWILAKGKIKGKDAFYNFTNELKKKIYFLTLSNWEISLLEHIDAIKSDYKYGISMNELVKQAKKANSGKAIKASTIEEFLNKHQMPSGNFIGDFVSGALVLTDEALNNNISDNVAELKKDVFGDDEGLDSFL
jgi:hypothetical protein